MPRRKSECGGDVLHYVAHHASPAQPFKGGHKVGILIAWPARRSELMRQARHLFFERFASLTPAPPPFSGMNSTPAFFEFPGGNTRQNEYCGKQPVA